MQPADINASIRLNKRTVYSELCSLHDCLDLLDRKGCWRLDKDHVYYVSISCSHCIDVQSTLMGIFDIFGQSMQYACHEDCFHVTYRSWYECNMTTIGELKDYVKQCVDIVKTAIDNDKQV